MHFRVLICSLALLLLPTPLFSQNLTTSRLSCEVENTPAATILKATVKGGDTQVTFRIDWKSGTETPEKFRNHPQKGQSITSSHLLGNATLTRTVFASESGDSIFIHILADQPGPVHFTARFVSEEPVEIHDRLQIILSGKETHAHAWIIPFESDVTNDGKIITLEGEGEALIILNLTPDPKNLPIADTLTRLGEKHDPGHTPPSPHLIWQAVVKEP